MKHKRCLSVACATALSLSMAAPALAVTNPTPVDVTALTNSFGYDYKGKYDMGTIKVVMYNQNDVYVNPSGIDVAVGTRTAPIDTTMTNNSKLISPTDFIENQGSTGLLVKATVIANSEDATTHEQRVQVAENFSDIDGVDKDGNAVNDSEGNPVQAATDKRIYAELQVRDCASKRDAFADNEDWQADTTKGIEYGFVKAVAKPGASDPAPEVQSTGVVIGKPIGHKDGSGNFVCDTPTYAAFRMQGSAVSEPKKSQTNATTGDIETVNDPWVAADVVNFNVAFTFQQTGNDTAAAEQDGTITGDVVLEKGNNGELAIALADPELSIKKVTWSSDNNYISLDDTAEQDYSASMKKSAAMGFTNNALSGEKATITATVTDNNDEVHTITVEVLSATLIQGAAFTGTTALTTASGGTNNATLTIGSAFGNGGDDATLNGNSVKYTWTSTNPAVATVEQHVSDPAAVGDNLKADVTAVGSGRTTIIAQATVGDKTYAAMTEVTVNKYGTISNAAGSEDGVMITGVGDTFTVAPASGAPAVTDALFTWNAGSDVTLTPSGANATVSAVTTAGPATVKVEATGADGTKWWAEQEVVAYAPAATAITIAASGGAASITGAPAGLSGSATYKWSIVNGGTAGATGFSDDTVAAPNVTFSGSPTAGTDKCTVKLVITDGSTKYLTIQEITVS